jgi:hypothetical protein
MVAAAEARGPSALVAQGFSARRQDMVNTLALLRPRAGLKGLRYEMLC